MLFVNESIVKPKNEKFLLNLLPHIDMSIVQNRKVKRLPQNLQEHMSNREFADDTSETAFFDVDDDFMNSTATKKLF